jgi:glycosyltransferase involved in cell wall biosynthesis
MKKLSQSIGQPMKLCLVFTHGVSVKTWAETGMMAREIKPYQELARLGIAEVSFLTCGGQEDIAFQAILDPIKILPAFAGHQPPKSQIRQLFGGVWALFRHRAHLQKCKIFKSNQMVGSHIAWLAAKFFQGKFLLRTGYEFYDFAKRRRSGNTKVFIAWLISYFGYNKAAHIVVATKSDAIIATKVFGAPANRVSIQPNWIETEHFAPALIEPIKERDFLTISRLDPQKNLAAVIQAAHQTNASLDILGSGPMLDELLTLVTELGADVNFLTPVSNDQLPDLIRRYHGFLLCSHFEGNPKALLEAMSCRVPVIGTKVPGIENLIRNGTTGFLCDKDTDSIAEAMQKLLNNPERAKLIAKSARKTIVKENSFAKFILQEQKRLSFLCSNI